MVQAAVPSGRVPLQVAHKTDPGLDPDKQVNEDACAYAEVSAGHLLVVCDGMGGHAAGREASQLALATIFREIEVPAPSPGAALKRAIEVAGRAVYELGGPPSNRLRPGSTCVALLVHAGGIEIAHVGDSRGYMLRAGKIYPLTRDHSMVQQMVDAGMLSPAEAVGHPDANKITRALGMAPEVEVELRPAPIPHNPGDLLLLATDGLVDLLSAEDIQAVVMQAVGVRGLAFACEQLVAQANARGGHDNITVLMAGVGESPAAPPRPTIPEGVAASAIAAPAAASPLPPPTAKMPPAAGSAPAVTLPEMPALADEAPGAHHGPPPTMIDETLGEGALPGSPPYAAAGTSGSFPQPQPQPQQARPALPVMLLVGVGLLALGVLIALVFLLWAVASGSSPPGDSALPTGQLERAMAARAALVLPKRVDP
jgi:protein phosphatase